MVGSQGFFNTTVFVCAQVAVSEVHSLQAKQHYSIVAYQAKTTISVSRTHTTLFHRQGMLRYSHEVHVAHHQQTPNYLSELDMRDRPNSTVTAWLFAAPPSRQ